MILNKSRSSTDVVKSNNSSNHSDEDCENIKIEITEKSASEVTRIPFIIISIISY